MTASNTEIKNLHRAPARGEMSDEKKNLNICRRQIPNKLSFRNPLKAVRKSKRKKAGGGCKGARSGRVLRMSTSEAATRC